MAQAAANDYQQGGVIRTLTLTMHGSKDSCSLNPPKKVSIKHKALLTAAPQEQLLFSESMTMDYVTLKGIENRFGIKKEDIPVFIFKELLDNALDYLETLSNNTEFAPEIHIQITSDRDRISLAVSNSNIAPIFTNERIHSIFNFNNFSSTKRNQYKISRGALGNGLKVALGMSYASATENYNHDSWSPLKIRTGDKLYSIVLLVDKLNRKDTPISVNINPEESILNNDSFDTTVEIEIPTGSNSKTMTLKQLLDTFKNYSILNPHVAMNIIVDGKQSSYPQVQKIKSDWNNLDSIYHYSYKEFENLITSLRVDHTTLYNFVSSIRLREASKLSKDGWNVPMSEIQNDKTVIRKLYCRLKKLAGPKDSLELPYDMRVKFRKKGIIERLNQWGIEVDGLSYQLVNAIFESDDGEVKFPYIFEVAEIETIGHKHEIISGINSSPVKLELMENPKLFEWVSKGKPWTSNLINIILREDCGYSRDHSKFKKANCIVLMHLVSPRIDYKGYGKAQIDFTPFPNLGDVIYNVCKGRTRESSPNKVTQRGLLTDFLKQRQIDVQKNPKFTVTDRWTPSDVWYACRPALLKNDIRIARHTRSNFTALIRVICDEKLHINMEELGIFAADRAQLYFQGNWYDVGFDELHSLKLKGTDLIIIEKEGIAEAFGPYADKIGVALLFTRGFATKYVRDLSELSKNAGCNIVVLTDYDDSGILLASKLKICRIGIDSKTLEYFNLKREDVEERYTPKNHLSSIVDLVNGEEFGYLCGKRIEINSVKSEVGTEKLWEWIIYKLKEVFPNRNYNRAIEVPIMVKPDNLEELYRKIEKRIESYIKSESENEVKNLTDFVGFIDDVPQKCAEIEERLKGLLINSSKYQDIVMQFQKLVESHSFFNDRQRNVN